MGPGYGGYGPISQGFMPQTMVRTYRNAREYEDDAYTLSAQGWRPITVTPVRPQARQSAGCLSGCGSCLLAPIYLPIALIVAIFSLGRVNLAAHPGDHLSVTYAWAPQAVAVTPQQYAQLTGWDMPALSVPKGPPLTMRALFREMKQTWEHANDPLQNAPNERRFLGLTTAEWRFSLIAGGALALLLGAFIVLLTHV